MTRSEAFLQRFHATRAGVTSSAMAHTTSYERLAELVRCDPRVLDLGCGDGHLLQLLGRGIGIDIAAAELAAARSRGVVVVQGRAQALPIAAASIDACVCHLAFMLFDQLDVVIGELARVLVPGGVFAAVIGGGPTADGDDSFHRFLAVMPQHVRVPLRLGDPRAKSETGWRDLFAAWAELRFERIELVLDGPIDDVWRFLGASYELADADIPAVRVAWLHACADLIEDHVNHTRLPCKVVVWLASVRRARA